VTTALLIALVVLAIGACVHGSVGFGMNLLAAPLLGAIDPHFIPGPLLVATLLLTILVLIREHQAVSIGQVGWAVAGRVPGAVLGAVAVAMLPLASLSIVLAVVVLAAVALSVTGLHIAVSRRSLFVAGAVSGFTGTTTSVGGPPMGLLYQHHEGPHVRGNLAGFFLFGVAFSIAVLAVTGGFGGEEARLSLYVVPSVLAGFVASGWTRRHVDRGWVRPAVLAVAGLSAVALLIRTLVG